VIVVRMEEDGKKIEKGNVEAKWRGYVSVG
jgi:hypothetical protein